MKAMFTIIKILSVISFIFLLHFLAVFFLPYPFNTINIFFAFFVLFTIGWEKSVIVWIAFFIFYIFELYAITPAGFIVVPGMLSVMAIYLLYVNVFTNRSWGTCVALSTIAILINRLVYLFLVYVLNYSTGISNKVLGNFFINLFWEVLFTGVFLGIIFFILSKKVNRFGRDRVNLLL